ncbi:hypothetical protein IJH16_01770 [Candidatus Saccharibacteria bacterium]|nr:hypothetical protein [Candidatus Saccharibacteria bacterium]
MLAFLSAASPTPPIALRYPLSYVFSGAYYWGDGNLDTQGSRGLWWSTKASSDSNAYDLVMGDNYLAPQDSSNKARGWALRCVSYSTSTRRYPLSYVYDGYYFWSDGTLNYQDSNSRYWATTAYSYNVAYYFGLWDGTADPQAITNTPVGGSLHFTIARRYPLSYVFSGNYYWGGGYLGNQGSLGYWWSTTALSDSLAYHLRMNSSDLGPQYGNNKAHGFSLRCVSYSTSARRYPLSYVLSGYYYWRDGTLLYQDSGGFWWSTAAYNDSEAYNLNMYSSNLGPQGHHIKARGLALRCVSRSMLCPSVSAFVCIFWVLLLDWCGFI